MNGEISVTVAEQVSVLLWAVAAGFAMGLYYDFFRAVRLFVHCGKTAAIIQDIFFWLTSAVAVFFICITVNCGYLRIYFVLAVLLSWVLYFFTLGHITMFIVNIAAVSVKRLASLCFKYIAAPAGRFVDNIFMLISQKISGLLTHITKNAKKQKKC